MGSFSNIRNYSVHGYRALQALFVASAATLTWSIVFLATEGMLTAALVFCLLVTMLAMVVLVHLQHTMSRRLAEASSAQTEKERLMRIDALTGAVMRRFFLEELQRCLGRSLAPRQATLIVVDIDHFKQLNDSFGHPFGDTVLVHLVAKMKSLFPDGIIGRLGGDEFAIILPHCDMPVITRRAQRLTEHLRAGIAHDTYVVPLSVSMGAALAPLHATQSKELTILADLALYESKAAGRGRLTVFDTGMLSDKHHHRFIERELRAAIYLNELELHYQPVVNPDGSVFGVEGLVRWRHPVRGFIPPSEFVPVAERSALIDTLGAWVFRQACKDSSSFPGCRISINISGEQLKRDEFIVTFARILEETGQSADRFVLEITETAATAATPEVLGRLGTARKMGFRIALDDFGTGFCGFNYLKTLPIDAIKIDRSYIQSLAQDDVARVFVSALTQIARIQKLSIVAEGVETAEDLTLAKAAGCNRFQGYHIARPAPKEKLAHFFERQPGPLAALAG